MKQISEKSVALYSTIKNFKAKVYQVEKWAMFNRFQQVWSIVQSFGLFYGKIHEIQNIGTLYSPFPTL